MKPTLYSSPAVPAPEASSPPSSALPPDPSQRASALERSSPLFSKMSGPEFVKASILASYLAALDQTLKRRALDAQPTPSPEE